MSPTATIITLGVYFGVLLIIARLTSGSGDSSTFFTANRQSHWFLVAFGMIGASLSGVTFISVPGWVGSTGFSYLQIVIGYLAGYAVIALVLLPLYYKMNLVSIYTYLQHRLGFYSYKTGAAYFLVSRTIGAAFRLFLVASVLQITIFDYLGVPFYAAVAATILLIWVYTFNGGIKTIVITDTLQTFFMLVAVALSLWLMAEELGWGYNKLLSQIKASNYAKIFHWEINSELNFFKQFLSGAFIAIVMTGLDQDMMQKNLTCRSLGDAQKNIFWFSVILIVVNVIFLLLGASLYLFAFDKGIAIPEKADNLFPLIAFNHLGGLGALTFILGITAAAYSSADSALTSLTTSFCVDFLSLESFPEKKRKSIRLGVHVGFSLALFMVILIFQALNNDSVIASVFRVAGYTYGPLLGLFSFGILTKFETNDKAVPFITILAVALSYLLGEYDYRLFNGYQFGFELLIVNGLITFVGLFLFKSSKG